MDNDLIEGNILLNNNIQKIMDHPDTSYIEPNKPFLPLF